MKAIPGFPGYFVTEDGEVFTQRRRGPGGYLKKELAPRKLKRARNGYLQVDLVRCGEKVWVGVHRLVLLAFVGPPPHAGLHARHVNGARDDNRLSNLAWATPRENNADKARHGTSQGGEKNGRAKLTREQVEAIRERLRSGERAVDLAKELGVGRSTIQGIKGGQTWKD